MNSEQALLSIDELAARSGIPTRTIRYYITTRLVAGPESRGKQARYTEDHLRRLRLIRCLTARHLPLDEVASRLDGLSTADVRALLAEEERQAAVLDEAARQPSPKAYIASLLRRATPGQGGMAAPAPQAAAQPVPPVPGSSPSVSTASCPAAPCAPRRTDSQAEAAYVHVPDVQGTSWKRWQLAPGLELHVLAGEESGYAALIDRLRQLAADAQSNEP